MLNDPNVSKPVLFLRLVTMWASVPCSAILVLFLFNTALRLISAPSDLAVMLGVVMFVMAGWGSYIVGLLAQYVYTATFGEKKGE